MTKLRIGLIGCGKISENHLNGYLGMEFVPNKHTGKYEFIPKIENPDNEIIAIADIQEENVNKRYQYYAEKGYTIPYKFSGPDAYKKVLELDLDGISICVPPTKDKIEIITDTLFAGKNILVEKPLSYDANSASQILDFWNGNTIFAMCYNWRNSFIMNKYKEMIEQQEFGKLHALEIIHAERYNYFDPNSFYFQLGYLWEHNVHDINYLRFLNGEIKWVEAVGYGNIPRNPSSWSLKYEYENGVKGLYHSLNGTRNPSFHIIGSFDKGIITGLSSNHNPDIDWPELPYFRIFSPEGEVFAKPIDTSSGIILHQNMDEQGVNQTFSHVPVITDFVTAIKNKTPPKSNVIDGYRDLKALEAIIFSIEKNGERTYIK